MNLAFPVITFPYASRILAPEGIGKINFANSVVAFFVTLALLGTNSYATREAAKIRDDKYALSKFTKEILFINIFSTVFSYLFFFILVFTVKKFENYTVLLLICSIKIFFMIFGMDWLYAATEEFQYITIRSIIFQIISIVFLFLFVRSPNDLYWYALFGILSAVGSNICNFIHSRLYVDLSIHCKLEVSKHLKYIFTFFGMTLVANVYAVLDTTMLGFLTNDTQVGYYSAATKIVKMIIGILTSLATVLLPRLSYCIEKQDKNVFSSLLEKSMSVFWLLSMPMTVGIFLLTTPLLSTFSGTQFLDAQIPMKIISPLVFIISTASLLGSPLSAMRKEKISLVAVICGAITNVTLNFCLIPKYGVSGAAIGTVVAESIVTGVQFIYLKTFFNNKNFWLNALQAIFATAIMGVAVFFIIDNTSNNILQLALCSSVGIFIYAGILLLFRNSYFIDILRKMKSYIKK